MEDFDGVYQRYFPQVYRYLCALCRDSALAEELAQETFVQALEHIERFRGECSLYAWLCQIGKNAWLKECRRQKHHETCPIEKMVEVASLELTPEEQVVQREERMRVRQAVQRLSEPYKDVFILHTYADVKLKEIAELYGKSETWARVTYYRAKQKIIQEVSK